MSDYQSEPKELIQKELESLQEISYVPKEYLRFRLRLWQAQFKIFESLSFSSLPESLPLRPGSIVPNPDPLSKMLLEVAECWKENTQSTIAKELRQLAENKEMLPGVIDWAVFGTQSGAFFQVSSQEGISLETLFFFGRALASPYIRKQVLAVKEETVKFSEKQRLCPYCNSEPGLSLLKGEQGKRFLACSLCGKEWEYPRLSCPFCGEDNYLELIRENDNRTRWIEFCSKCKYYLKTTDTRKGNQVFPLKEAILGLYLDFIAQEQNLKQSPPYVALR